MHSNCPKCAAGMVPDPASDSKHIDPKTGIRPISEWGNECARGLQYKDLGVVLAGPNQRRTFSGGRKVRGMASDAYDRQNPA